MNKLKRLNKKIRRLELGIQKDTKKLAKLRHKAATVAEGRSKAKGKSAVRAKPVPRTAKAPKRKSGLTPEGRAKLAAIMNARWAAKRAAAAASAPPSPGS